MLMRAAFNKIEFMWFNNIKTWMKYVLAIYKYANVYPFGYHNVYPRVLLRVH